MKFTRVYCVVVIGIIIIIVMLLSLFLCLCIQGDKYNLPQMPESRALGVEQYPIYNIPREIRPKLCKFRLEVGFLILYIQYIYLQYTFA